MLGSFASITTGNSALGASSWAAINAAGNYLISKCMVNTANPGGGVIVIQSGKQITPPK